MNGDEEEKKEKEDAVRFYVSTCLVTLSSYLLKYQA